MLTAQLQVAAQCSALSLSPVSFGVSPRWVLRFLRSGCKRLGRILEKKVKRLNENDEELVRLTKNLQRYKEKVKYLDQNHSKKKQIERLD